MPGITWWQGPGNIYIYWSIRRYQVKGECSVNMKALTISVFVTILAVNSKAQAQNPGLSITGIWKGISLCQVKNTPCHDERVVYYISRVQGADTFTISASKIINGREEDMGVIGCKLDSKNNKLFSTAYGNLWTFNFKGKTLEGTLHYKGELYRIIKLTKQE